MRNLVIISAPSGAGKTTLCRELQRRYPEIGFSVSCTTRSKRPYEVDGYDYHFISVEEFEERIRKEEFAEFEQVHGDYYGTMKDTLEEAMDSGTILLLEVDVQGAMAIKEAYPERTVTVFIFPASVSQLRERLRKRGADSEERITQRLQRFDSELSYRDKFEFQVVNDDVERASNELMNIINQCSEGVIHGA